MSHLSKEYSSATDVARTNVQAAQASQQRALAALEGQARHVEAAAAELPLMWRDGLAAKPLGAFKDDGEEDRIFEDASSIVPHVEVSMLPRPGEDELIAEFRGGPRDAHSTAPSS